MQQPIDEDSPHDKPVSLLIVDPKKLGDMVRDKNFESLSQFGGVKELALILETDVKNGINADEADVIHRQNVFGANKYPKHQQKGFLNLCLMHLKIQQF